MNKETNIHVFISFFRFGENRFWAFKQMLLGPRIFSEIPGLQFYKFLGTGGAKGFSLWPDFGTYAILTVWKSPTAFIEFQKKNPYWQEYRSHAKQQRTLGLIPIHSHGLWSGMNPFAEHQIKDFSVGDAQVAVLTRATLHWKRLISFWRSVPLASKTIEKAKGVHFYKGVGEWPFVQQATVSIWDNFQAVHDFAYKQQGHAAIVRKTRKQKWYQEDLFSRFVVLTDTQFQDIKK